MYVSTDGKNYKRFGLVMAKEIIECKLKQTKMKLASDEISEAIKISSDGYNNQNKQQKLRAGKAFFPLPNLL